MGTALGFRLINGSREREGERDGPGDVIEFLHARVAIVVCVALFLSVFTAVRLPHPASPYLRPTYRSTSCVYCLFSLFSNRPWPSSQSEISSVDKQH